METFAVIPARHASVRFPGKPLALLLGKPMVQHVYERCVEAGVFTRVLIATDDARIAQAAQGFGAEAVLTSPECQSGTDRVAEVARGAGRGAQTVWVNVQGDEPAVHPEALQALVRAFEDPQVQMATLVRPLQEAERPRTDVVKAVVSQDGFGLYFSRADVPHQREGAPPPKRWAHLGMYGYRQSTLLRLSTLAPSPLELSESLEQLRALENGVRIACRETPHVSAAVDRPDDVPAAEALLRRYFEKR